MKGQTFTARGSASTGKDKTSPVSSPAKQAPTKPCPRVKVLLVDDHPVVRKGLVSCLGAQPHLEVVGEAADGLEALRKAHELGPDIVIMDISMPRMNGFAATEAFRTELPNVKVLLLSMYTHPEYVLRIIKSGARGYLPKVAPFEELLKAIETVHRGQTYFTPDIACAALNHFVQKPADEPDLTQLTTREQEVLTHIVDGLFNKEIASRLNIGTRTVETHRERIMRKLNIHSVAGLTRFAMSKGLVTPTE